MSRLIVSFLRRLSRWTVFAAVAFASTYPTLASAVPLDPSGLWFTKGDASIIRIAPCGTNFCGKLAWLKEPKQSDGSPKLDKNNKDASKQTRPMLGLDLLLDLTADEDHWAGKAYNPEDGKVYDITFKVDEPKGKPASDTAEIRGCILRYLCKSETFKRAVEIPRAQASH